MMAWSWMCAEWHKRLLRGIGLCLLWWATLPAAEAAPTRWQTLSPGLEYASLSHSTGRIHAFRIDLRRYHLDVALAKDYQLPNASVRDLAARAEAVVAINGGFFSPAFEPLGLRIQRGTVRSPLKATSWWGVFHVSQRRAQIVPPQGFTAGRHTTMAVQSGPRLVVKGAIPTLKGGEAERSALGITTQGQVVIAITDHAPLSTSVLAEILRRSAASGGLGCRDALNLDGGRSAQLYARIGRFQLHVPNLSVVTDAVIVRRK